MENIVRHLRSSETLLETTARLLNSRDRLLQAYSCAAQRQQTARMNYLNRRVQEANSFLKSLAQIQSDLYPHQTRPRFVVSSFFLHECFRQLTADKKEQFFFVTGSEVNDALVLDQICTFEHLSRTEAGVVADPKSTHRVLARLERFGHRLLAHFHSHPGKGAASTGPSGIDTNYQAGLERSGYPTLAGVFSRDGYVRFFRLDQNFDLHIHGTGVEHVEATIFRLTDFS